jgi:hypothetical protein
MVARLCLPMSSARFDSNQTAKPKFGMAGVCTSIDTPLP